MNDKISKNINNDDSDRSGDNNQGATNVSRSSHQRRAVRRNKLDRDVNSSDNNSSLGDISSDRKIKDYSQQNHSSDVPDVGNIDKPNSSIISKLIIGVSVVAIFAAVVFAFVEFSGNKEQVLMAKVVSVTPNYNLIQIPTTECHDVTTSKQVANPNRNFFNGVFDSKNHPKYVTKTATKQVCSQTNVESQVLVNYTVQYQVKNAVESMIVTSPPPVNTVMPITQLQQYVESTVVSAVPMTNQSNKINSSANAS